MPPEIQHGLYAKRDINSVRPEHRTLIPADCSIVDLVEHMEVVRDLMKIIADMLVAANEPIALAGVIGDYVSTQAMLLETIGQAKSRSLYPMRLKRMTREDMESINREYAEMVSTSASFLKQLYAYVQSNPPVVKDSRDGEVVPMNWVERGVPKLIGGHYRGLKKWAQYKQWAEKHLTKDDPLDEEWAKVLDGTVIED